MQRLLRKLVLLFLLLLLLVERRWVFRGMKRNFSILLAFLLQSLKVYSLHHVKLTVESPTRHLTSSSILRMGRYASVPEISFRVAMQ